MARKPITSPADLQEHIADKQAAYASSFTYEGRDVDAHPVAPSPPPVRADGGEMQVLNQSSPDGLPAVDPARLSKPAVVVGNALDRNFRSDVSLPPATPGSRIAKLEAELLEVTKTIFESKKPEEILEAREEHDRLSELLVEAREEQARIDKANEPRVRYYRVLNEKEVRLGGTVVIRPGKIVDSLNFKISVLQQHGIRLKEIERVQVNAFIPDGTEDRMSGLN